VFLNKNISQIGVKRIVMSIALKLLLKKLPLMPKQLLL
jgi:hypothetical protein